MGALFSGTVGPAPAIVLLVVALTCAVTDLARGKIYNAVTYPAMALGVVLSVWQHGASGIFFALGGFAVGFFPAFVLFALGGMGGGDVKLLGAIGAIAGAVAATETLILAFLVGGIFALGKLAWHGRLFATLGRTLRSIFGALWPGLKPAAAAEEGRLEVRFGVAICVALVATLWDLRSGALSSLL
ncbi:MAG TPA: A24 family peptidase [Polyangia bacterium]